MNREKQRERDWRKEGHFYISQGRVIIRCVNCWISGILCELAHQHVRQSDIPSFILIYLFTEREIIIDCIWCSYWFDLLTSRMGYNEGQRPSTGCGRVITALTEKCVKSIKVHIFILLFGCFINVVKWILKNLE